MAKGPKTTRRIPKGFRRKPKAPHVKTYHTFREKKGKPKAKLPSSRGQPLTFERYLTLMQDYERRAKGDLKPKQERADRYSSQILQILFHSLRKLEPEEERQLEKAFGILRPERGATVSFYLLGHTIANQIVKDFGRTSGLRVFGFGVGYAQLLFFLRNFMRAKVKGVDLGYFSKEFTKRKRLGVRHGKSAADPSLRKLGKFDATYSINVFETDIIDRKEALGMLDNMAAMTRKGGKSYHIVTGGVAVSREEIEARGFRIDKWENLEAAWEFIKLTKIRD